MFEANELIKMAQEAAVPDNRTLPRKIYDVAEKGVQLAAGAGVAAVSGLNSLDQKAPDKQIKGVWVLKNTES